MPASGFGNPFAIPRVDTQGLRNIPQFNPNAGLSALIQAQNAVMRGMGGGGRGGGAYEAGGYKGVGDPSKGRWVKLPGQSDLVWVVGTTEKERNAAEAKALNAARAQILQTDTELQTVLKGFADKSIPGMETTLEGVRKSGIIARLAPQLEMSEADTAKLILDTPQQQLEQRRRAVSNAGLFRQLQDVGAEIADKFTGAVEALGASAEEKAAIGQRMAANAERRRQENARADEFARLEREGRSTAGYWLTNPFDTAAMHAAPLAATLVPQLAAGTLGSFVGGPIGATAGFALGGGLSSAAYGAGEMLERAATDPNLTPEQRAQAASDAYTGGGIVSGLIGAIPAGPSSIATALGRRAAARTASKLPEYAAADATKRAAMVAEEYAARRAEHGLLRRAATSGAMGATDAATLGIAEQAGHNLAYAGASGQDIPITEGWGEQGLAGAVLGAPLGFFMGRRARYIYPGGRYPTPEPMRGPVVNAEILPLNSLPSPGAPTLGLPPGLGPDPTRGPAGPGSWEFGTRATTATPRPETAQAQATQAAAGAVPQSATLTPEDFNAAVRRSSANLRAMDALDAEVSKQAGEVSALLRRAKSIRPLQRTLTERLESGNIAPQTLAQMAQLYPANTWRKQGIERALAEYQARQVAALPPTGINNIRTVLGREAAEVEAYRGRSAEPVADVAADGRLAERPVDTADTAAHRAEPVDTTPNAATVAARPAAEAGIRDTTAEGRGDAGAAAPDTGQVEAPAATPAVAEPGRVAPTDGERGIGAAAEEPATAGAGERGVEPAPSAGPRGGSDGTDIGRTPPLKKDGTVNLRKWDAAIKKGDDYATVKNGLVMQRMAWGENAVRRYYDPEYIRRDIAEQGGSPENARRLALAAREVMGEKTPDTAVERYFAEQAHADERAFWTRRDAENAVVQQEAEQPPLPSSDYYLAEAERILEVLKRPKRTDESLVGPAKTASPAGVEHSIDSLPNAADVLVLGKKALYPGMDYPVALEKATDLIRRKAAGDKLNAGDKLRYNQLKRLGVPDMEVNAPAVEAAVTQSREMGLPTTKRKIITERPGKGKRRVLDNPHCPA